MKKYHFPVIVILLWFGLVFLLVLPEYVSKPAYANFLDRECVVNGVGVDDSTRKVVKQFGSTYSQENRVIPQDESGGQVRYLAFVYPDGVVYLDDGLVKAIELTTARYGTARGVKVGDSRSVVEEHYWRPFGSRGSEGEYVYNFKVRLVISFRHNKVVQIFLYP